jgi:hypothetical protein
MVDATVPEENSHRIPTVPGHQLKDLLKAATVSAAPAEAAAPLVTATLAMEAATAGAPHTGMTRSKTQFNGSDATPYPSKMLVATMTKNAFTFLSAWTKHHSPGSSHLTRTRLTSGTSSRLSSPATSRVPWDARVFTWTWQWQSRNKARRYASTCDTFCTSALR